jgi:hypothetical protein
MLVRKPTSNLTGFALIVAVLLGCVLFVAVRDGHAVKMARAFQVAWLS